MHLASDSCAQLSQKSSTQHTYTILIWHCCIVCSRWSSLHWGRVYWHLWLCADLGCAPYIALFQLPWHQKESPISWIITACTPLRYSVVAYRYVVMTFRKSPSALFDALLNAADADTQLTPQRNGIIRASLDGGDAARCVTGLIAYLAYTLRTCLRTVAKPLTF